MLFIVDF